MRNKKSQLIMIIMVILILLESSQSFILSVKKGYSKCFKAQPSPDKAKFGFPRRQKQNCDVFFTIDLIQQTQQGKIRKSIHSDMQKCHQMHPGQPAVIKHTIDYYSMNGNYQICVNVMEDRNQQLFIEIFIGEKLNPLLYGQADQVLPLIQSEQLIELDLKVQRIRRSLGWSRKLLTQGTQNGDKLQAQLNQINDFTVNATIFQIIFLIMYGFSWILYMKQQKVN